MSPVALFQASKAYFMELLRVRYSSPLFRLPSADHIKRQVSFHNTGPQQARARHLYFDHSTFSTQLQGCRCSSAAWTGAPRRPFLGIYVSPAAPLLLHCCH
jgi:hypothetical protein